MGYLRKRRSLFLLIGILTLSACNGGGGQAVTSDWVDHGAPAANPATPNAPEPTPDNPAPASQLYTGPAELEKYVVKFMEDSKLQGLDLSNIMTPAKLNIQISSLAYYGAGVLGLCETAGGARDVTIDPTFWNSASETEREVVVHHELGHCVLYRPHRSDMLSSGIYASIMYPSAMSSSMYAGNYDYYQQELYSYNVSLGGQTEESSNTYVCY